jgi:hypothetical protein
MLNTASQVGYGAVIASLAGFVLIRDAVLGIAPGNPLVSLSIAVNVLAGITGSASGGMSIALQTLGATYLEMGRAAGIAPELLHRVTAIATGGLDALPHNGAVITLLAICKLTHRQSYSTSSCRSRASSISGWRRSSSASSTKRRKRARRRSSWRSTRSAGGSTPPCRSATLLDAPKVRRSPSSTSAPSPPAR